MKEVFETPIGKFGVEIKDRAVVRLDYYNAKESYSLSPLANKVKQELLEYLDGSRKEFDVPVSMEGTAFQVKVWEELKKIPYGETISYQELAEKVGSPDGARAVGMACNKNPVSIIVPCHRVIGKSGNLTGYATGLDLKSKLLNLESENKDK